MRCFAIIEKTRSAAPPTSRTSASPAARAMPARRALHRGRIDAGEAQDRRNLRREITKRVVAAALNKLPRAGVERNSDPVVEHLVSRLRQQQIALWPRDARHL